MKTIIVSPSGNWYGSEQMLFGHLENTLNDYNVYVKSNGRFVEELKKVGKHKIIPFSSLKTLYLRIFWKLGLTRINSIYINEGGHINYVKILARIFSKKNFVIHIRLLDDCKLERTSGLPSNVKLLCVSDYIKTELFKSNPNLNNENVYRVHDFVSKPEKKPYRSPVKENKVRVGVVGRFSSTKGVRDILTFLKEINKNSNSEIKVQFNIFGDVIEDDDVLLFKSEIRLLKHVDVLFHGFVMDKNLIYKNVDLIIHFNCFDAFPRIYFEALSHLVPVLGFRSGGIGEQAKIMGFDDLLVDRSVNWERKMYDVILHAYRNITNLQSRVHESWRVFDKRLNRDDYIAFVEKKINV